MSNGLTVLQGDCIEMMRTLPDASVNCCVTSPPYFGLRDYGVDGQIGLEPTPDAYVARMVEVFREVRRLLRDDGTLWLNLGDSYAAQRGGSEMPAETLAGGSGGKSVDSEAYRGRGFSPKTIAGQGGVASRSSPVAHRNARAFGLKHKDLIGIPWRVALALQADGWYLRQDIIWHKPNPMPESVKDRCTKAHEYIFMLAKSERYYFDADAIHETAKDESIKRAKSGVVFGGQNRCPDIRLQSGKRWNPDMAGGGTGFKNGHSGNTRILADGTSKTYVTRNRRSVWTVATKPYKGAHFATFPPKLIEPCILAGCPVGGVVLDPFGGSGTTAEVALKHGRRAILCELNPAYVELIKQRTEQQVLLSA